MPDPDDGDDAETDDGLVGKPSASRGRKVVDHLRGRADTTLTTDEIMSLTRDEAQHGQ